MCVCVPTCGIATYLSIMFGNDDVFDGFLHRSVNANDEFGADDGILLGQIFFIMAEVEPQHMVEHFGAIATLYKHQGLLLRVRHAVVLLLQIHDHLTDTIA